MSVLDGKCLYLCERHPGLSRSLRETRRGGEARSVVRLGQPVRRAISRRGPAHHRPVRDREAHAAGWTDLLDRPARSHPARGRDLRPLYRAGLGLSGRNRRAVLLTLAVCVEGREPARPCREDRRRRAHAREDDRGLEQPAVVRRRARSAHRPRPCRSQAAQRRSVVRDSTVSACAQDIGRCRD